MDPGWITAIVAVAVAVAGFGLWAGRLLWRTLQRVGRFLDDFFGHPERDGVPALPGVLARLAETEKLLSRLVAETEPNGGTSLRDVVARTAADVAQIKDEQARLRTHLELRNQPPPDGRPR